MARLQDEDVPPRLTPAARRLVALALLALSTAGLAMSLARMAEIERVQRRPPLDTRLDPNCASAAELVLLPGVGPVTAQRIVQSRRQQGRFADAAALARVRGVGRRTVERLAPMLRFDGDCAAGA
ncbi:MAG: helix-hairpin-helix domain-containing protein [Planctomycetota bacterium]|nr:MAG: helix-hairpin-helix domain-containing protein [Planctomycetota bacterium]